MTTQEIADQLASLCREGKFREATEAFYSKDIVSVEAASGPDGSREAKGLDAVIAKGDWWVANHEVHGVTVEGPIVADPFFTVRFKIEVTFKPTGNRMVMDELAVYKVADGKIVWEEFFYKV